MTVQEWLELYGYKQGDVMCDDIGEYVMYIDEDGKRERVYILSAIENQ